MDKFVQFTGRGLTLQQCLTNEGNTSATDINPNNSPSWTTTTATRSPALWNYAQHFAMSDNSCSSTVRAFDAGRDQRHLGQHYGTICGPASSNINAPVCTAAPGSASATPGTPAAQGPGTNYSDSDPNYDECSATQDGNTAAGTIQMGGTNVGDLLDQATSPGAGSRAASSTRATRRVSTTRARRALTARTHTNKLGGASVKDYSPHHEPFQYYASTANPQHLPPTSISMIGHQDQANHQYDLATSSRPRITTTCRRCRT